jgi:hypothetical protein
LFVQVVEVFFARRDACAFSDEAACQIKAGNLDSSALEQMVVRAGLAESW